MDKKALVEAAKEAARLALLAGVATLVTTLLAYFNTIQNPELPIVAITFVLRSADKYIHKSESKLSGLTPF